MSSPVELLYFDLSAFGVGGRGGVVSLFFESQGIAYKSIFPTAEGGWPVQKKEYLEKLDISPFGHLPVVFEDGKALIEHHAILRYFAKKTNSYGKDASQDYYTDSVAESTKEWRADWVSSTFEKDEEKTKKYKEELVKFYYAGVEALLRRVAFKGNFQFGDAPSYADVAVAAQVYDDIRANVIAETTLSSYPLIKKTFESFFALPSLESWLKTHGPATKK
eukprot:TRINITY_DN8138_c0_g1_i1.p1 TRINITY_DN8138_c0_g1~~TRINITY_DN8138_c0_g1_i1.p1  ORF type:complete len:220 (-),score=80.37 TRINITY_DN8138_c0_g1_i1:47-706(-)